MVTAFLIGLAVLAWLPLLVALWLAGRVRALVREVAAQWAESVPWLERMRTPTARLMAERDRLIGALVARFPPVGIVGRLVRVLIWWRADELCTGCIGELDASGRPDVDLPWLAGYLAAAGIDRILAPVLWLVGLVSAGLSLLAAGGAAAWIVWGG